MTIDLRDTTKREALQQLVERAIEDNDVLWQCMITLGPEFFAYDYDLRMVYFALVAWEATGRYDPATNRERLVAGLAAVEAVADDPHPGRLGEVYRDRWWQTLDDWYVPWTVVKEYVGALLQALIDTNEIEADLAAVLRDAFANSPLAVDELIADAAWDRIRNAVLGRRALHLSKFAPALPPAPPPANEWEGILRRAAS